ncbi:signal recognition particle-docking protein FtsY [Mycoplasmopsis agassizii]|uniref:Signal recognition particle receptor FtsY n=1 Tax=Mycoplasmopsis agassizii TaxID=33922 RepID=A0A269TK71_9BACT|nr:signal recognition particle-docking protein FtsY [Mycoplasmopsis agassizii]PAK21560.1 signal recognition particle-docking protein FtsY [Mycoplasmopsis agassizii]
MGFFKKLKEKIFRIKTDDEKKLEKEDKLEEKKAKKLTEAETKEIKKLQEVEAKIEQTKLVEIEKATKVEKFVTGLAKSNSNFSKALLDLNASTIKIDETYFESLEEILIMSDVSLKLTNVIIHEIKETIKRQGISDKNLISEIIVDKMFLLYANQDNLSTELNFQDGRLNVFMMVGVNGSGKTTSIAKIAAKFIKQNKKVLIAAADTFRAAAAEQLSIWAKRVGADIVTAKKENQDPASVVYETLEKAKKENYDLVIIDTAGRLQNKVNLMNELEKLNRIVEKFIEREIDEALLVLDATTGQNGISQAKAFKEVTKLSGIILTKMDGTSKGGIVLTIKDEFDIHVKFIGVGEKIDDLTEFDLDKFIYAMAKDVIETSDLT